MNNLNNDQGSGVASLKESEDGKDNDEDKFPNQRKKVKAVVKTTDKWRCPYCLKGFKLRVGISKQDKRHLPRYYRDNYDAESEHDNLFVEVLVKDLYGYDLPLYCPYCERCSVFHYRVFPKEGENVFKYPAEAKERDCDVVLPRGPDFDRAGRMGMRDYPGWQASETEGSEDEGQHNNKKRKK